MQSKWIKLSKKFQINQAICAKILILSFITMKCNKRTQEHTYEYPLSYTYSQSILNQKIKI